MSMVVPTAASAAQEHHNSFELLNWAESMSQSFSTADSCDNLYQPPDRLSSNLYCANRKQTHCFLGDIPYTVYYKGSWSWMVKNTHCSE